MTDSAKSARTRDAGTPPILTLHGDWAELRLNRPDVHNRFEPTDLDVLCAHIETLNQDHAVRVVVLTGTGSQTFSSGYHLGALKASRPDTQNTFEEMVDAVESMRAVTIARINGSMYGGASDLALACDFRIGVQDAQMSVPAARLGLHFYGHGLRRWVSRVGLNTAKRVFLTAQVLGAEELATCGFFTQVVETAELDAECNKLVDQLRALAPLALQGMKQVMNAVANGEYIHKKASQLHFDSLRSTDFAEGCAAIAVKRSPIFTGK